ncbi:uncharacterized protein EV420DRAFT_1487673 [Desarmillaria tabescens]|uniref:Uncharacterized protein n=1 Tax=Armillaria tabescens TaxID=1929756 RepID=A0AA39J600_ARMTA|nr:uncharacterized protein EV420DRAFT_1487673 [Desarmillaria tabescens]KAK0436080.1 hypothetical protein EV420DRAFT_1487673 [Desarmillaria tabescens]
MTRSGSLAPKHRRCRCASKGTITQAAHLKPKLPSSPGFDANPSQDGLPHYEDGLSSPATVLPENHPQLSISQVLTCPGTPPSLYETVFMESPSDRPSHVPISTDTSRQMLPCIAFKGTSRVQLPVELYLLCSKDLDLQFTKQIVLGMMFEIDDEEEALQKLLSDLNLCIDRVLNVAGVSKRFQRMQNILHRIQEVHGWIVELQTHVFAEGREYLVREYDNMALMYQREW